MFKFVDTRLILIIVTLISHDTLFSSIILKLSFFDLHLFSQILSYIIIFAPDIFNFGAGIRPCL